MFEQASRQKLRFQSSIGQLSVEDLWDLPLTSKSKVSLDGLAVQINRQLKDEQQESFVTPVTSGSDLQVKLDILKHIIRVKMDENQARLQENERAEKKRKIADIIARKEDQSLESLSIEELRTMHSNV